jgi:outer membrane protein assembly factor BamB
MKSHIWVSAVLLAVSSGLAAPASESVIMYHNSLDRHGDYIVPGLTLSAAANMHMDKRFQAKVSGHIYAQPLFWKPSTGNDEVIAATESNIVYALDAKTGATVWQTPLAKNARLTELPCGNIDPIGVTGTPVIDPQAGVLYLDALTTSGKAVRHLLYALSLADGSIVAHWPLDVEAALKALGVKFSSAAQGERSALLFFGGYLYVNFGGNFGDCGTYHGTVIQVQTSTPSIVASWATRANGGGIWAQGGIAGDGKSLFLTTGNTFGATKWSDGEAIIRLQPGLKHSKNKKDFFAPTNWMELDNTDLDLGGTEALPLNIAVPNAPPAKRVLALGKDGNAYLADRTNLGGIGGQLAELSVSIQSIRTAAAVYSTSAGTSVAFTNAGSSNCSGTSMTMLGIAASGSQPITELWCTAFNGGGSPIITTTDGTTSPIVWVVGAEGDNVLHGFDATNGNVVFSGNNEVMNGLHHFQTIMVADRRFYVAADGTVYAFAF